MSCPAELTLNRYGVSAVTGFMPEVAPTRRLPPYYEPWEVIIDHLPELIVSGLIEERVRQLPQLSVSDEHLPTEGDRWRAYVVATFIGQGYVWRDVGAPRAAVPASIAVPWHKISERLDMPPVVSYSTAVLHNWGLRDPTGSLNGENLYSLVTYTGLKDESWFYIVSLLVEVTAVPALKAVLLAYEAIRQTDSASLLEHMKVMKRALGNMANALKEMTKERCDPAKFYGRIRQFQKGSSDDLLKKWDGLLFEGVSERPLQFCGASAAQSSTIPVFDIFLGVEHSGENLDFLVMQRKHMPPRHREFLAFLQQQPSAREYIRSCSEPELSRCYDEMAECLREFRRNHYKLVNSYIITQIPRPSSEAKVGAPRDDVEELDQDSQTDGAKGTGGTALKAFLKGVKDDIKNLSRN